MQSIYYIEDDTGIAYGVQAYLQSKGFNVIILDSVEKAKQQIEKRFPSLILVDWNLPDGSGDKLCRWIRKKQKKLPVIFLTVKNDTKDIVQGFQIGADDYITKPFELEILYSRICALLRRFGDGQEERLMCGTITVDTDRLEVFAGSEKVNLSSTEYQLLVLLMKNKNHTLTRQRLLEMLWDSNGSFVNDNTLTVTVKRLREKLHYPACIKTVRSFGYRMEDDAI